MASPQYGTGPGASQLDDPPPSPANTDGMSPGPSLDAIMGPQGRTQVPSNQIPPQVLTGMLQAASQMNTIINSFAQATPDLAPDWAICKAALASAMAKVQLAGAGPTAPTSTGPAFPGGGIDAGGFPPPSPQG